MVIYGTLQEINMATNQINKVILVGGSSRIREIKEMLEKIFTGIELNFSLNPDEAIAYGATLRAKQIVTNDIPSVKLNEANAKRLKEQKKNAKEKKKDKRSNGLIDQHGVEWEMEDVVLDTNQIGLGFVISGGRDGSDYPDHYIRVTEIDKGGAVARDGRIKVGDVILKVNNTDTVDVGHQVAVDALKISGSIVRLLVKRSKPTQPQIVRHKSIPVQRSPPEIQRLEQMPGVRNKCPALELYKSNGLIDQHGVEWEMEDVVLDTNQIGLGFVISGGRDGSDYPDHYIRVTEIDKGGAVARDGRIKVGDVILKVNNTYTVDVEHQVAVDALKTSGSIVRLLVRRSKPTQPRIVRHTSSDGFLRDRKWPHRNSNTFSEF